MIRLIIFAAICHTVTNAQRVLDSRLIGAPRIQCEESRIRLSIRTNEPFGGNVYAKGFFNKDICRVQGNGIGNSANITIPVAADCGMRRRRMADPKGLVLEMTIVLMFHGKFLTRNDKAYHIECVYMELSQKVSNKLDISAIPSTQLSESVSLQSDMSALPKCKYEVLDKDENGQAISFAAIGQPIYHRWTCQSPNAVGVATAGEKLYCLTVHSCEVDDGQGSVQKLLDINGCPVDRALLDDVDYKSDLEAGRQGFVFKFADRPTVYFGCQLRLELKPEWKQQCRRTSEKCRAFTDTAGIKNGTVPTIYGRGSPSEDEEDDPEVTPDFPRPSPSVTTTVTTTPFTTTTTLATSATTVAVKPTPTKVTARLTTTSKSASAVVSRPKLQSPQEETYPSDFVDIPLSAPRPNARTDGEDVWQTVMTSPKGRVSSKEVLPAQASKEGQVVSPVDDNSVDPPPADGTKYEEAEEQAQAPYPESPGTVPEQTGSEPEAIGTVEGTSGDEAVDMSSDGANAQTEADGAQQRVRLRDATAGGLTTPILKRRRTSRSTPADASVPERLLYYDVPMENDRRVTDGGGIRVEKFRLKQPQRLDNGADKTATGLKVSDSAIRSFAAIAQPRPGTFVDIDVTAPEVDVFDVPQIPVIHAGSDSPSASESYVQYTRAPERIKLRDLSSQSDRVDQWCISHQALSIALFTSSFVLVGAFAALTIAFQRFRRKSPREDSYMEFTPQKRRTAPTADYLVGYGGEDSNSASATARRFGLKNSAYTIHSGAHSSATIA